MLLVLIITIALMSICHMPNNLICLYNDNELNALTHIFIGFMSNTKVTLSEFLFELKLNFHIISSPKQFFRGLQIFISIHTRMKFLVYGASGSIKIKYGFRPKKMKFLADGTSGSIKHGFRPNLYYVKLQVHQIWLQAIKIENFTRWNFRFHQNQIRLRAIKN